MVDNLNKFQIVLDARVADLEHMIRRRDLIAVEQHADHVDEFQQAAE
jgi:hypothetical protein